VKQAAAAAVLVAVALIAYVSPHSAAAQPELTEALPADGSILDGPPTVVRLCFSELPLHDETDQFSFDVTTPEGTNLGLRIVFQPLTNCVDVHLGLQGLREESPYGEWLFEWQVIGADSEQPASGQLLYQVVEEGGSPVPDPSPVVPTTPAASGTETLAGGTPTPAPAGSDDDDDGGLDTVWIAVIAGGVAAGGLAVGGAVFYLLRRAGSGRTPPDA
jgi:methionine-rich copper-binding protein CopC